MGAKFFRAVCITDPKIFTEFADYNAPRWLTGEGSVKGSNEDDSWFWKDHVLKLEVGQSVSCDFWCYIRMPDLTFPSVEVTVQGKTLLL